MLTFGETMALVRSSAIGPISTNRQMTIGLGGAESNVAIGLARLGVPVTWISRLGADSFGELVLRELRAEGVTPVVSIERDHPTGLMVKERCTAGTSRVTYYRSGSAASLLSAQDIPDGRIAAADIVHVTGITPALSASAAQAVTSVMSRARALGRLVSLDVNYRSRLWTVNQAAPVLSKMVAEADIVFAGDDEAELLVGEHPTPTELASAVAELGPTEVVIKLGAAGCVALIDGVIHAASALPVSVVDTVGAGDAFVAGYLAERLLGADPDTRLRTATAAGAFACMSDGDWEGLPTRLDLDSLGNRDAVSR